MSGKVSDFIARWNPSSSAEEGRAFVQRRLALFTQLMFWSFFALIVFINVMYEVYPATRPEHSGIINIFSSIGLAVLVGAFFAARRAKVYSYATLHALDAVAVVMMSIAFGVSGVLSADKPANVYSSFLWISFAVFARVLVVPSSGKRTVIISSLSMVPIMVASFILEMETPTPALVVGALMFCVVIVVLSSVGSQVIYGLRAQVREAMQLGQYTLVDKIGEGGMGSVYRARHTMLRRPTAIKLLRPDRTGRTNLQRFEREVQLTSELTHPNTVAIYDYGRSPDGLFYYAMEFLDGTDLETLVRRAGPQPPGRVVHILKQVCGALNEAHSRGLIHRDIKPGNIILCSRGMVPDVAKVVDFGLVKELTREGAGGTGDIIAGTPAYLSPEAVTSPELIGPCADLYALGAVGYFLVTGELVFQAGSMVEMALAHVNEEPKPPSERTRFDVSDGLDAVLLRCLAKRPDDRYPDALALADALSAVPEMGTWTEADARTWWADFGHEELEVGERGPVSPMAMTVDLRGRESDDTESVELGTNRTVLDVPPPEW